jgi:hypothetical protein
VRQAAIDQQADGSRARDTMSGGPEWDAFKHLDRRLFWLDAGLPNDRQPPVQLGFLQRRECLR